MNKNNWISVYEDLPHHEEFILAHGKLGFCVCIFINTIKMNEELDRVGHPEEKVDTLKQPYFFCSQERKGHVLRDVTHWMKLVYPYSS